MIKRCLIFLVFIAIVTGGAFSDSSAQNNNCQTAIHSGAGNLFSEYSMFIPLSINSNYYFQNEEDPFILWKLSPYSAGDPKRAEDTKWLAFALNLFLGFGIGSFVQGDIDGGLISVLGTVGGYTLIIVGGLRMARTIENEIYGGDGYISFSGIGFIIAGSFMLLGTKIFELVRPFSYASKLSVAFSPGIDSNGQPTFTAMGRVAY